MKTTLVYAGIAGTGGGPSGEGFMTAGHGLDGGWISHGLCSLAAAATARGLAIDLIDLRALRDWEHLRAEVARRGSDVFGLTMMSVDYNPVMRAIAVIKEALPSATVVVGGPHPSILPDSVLANPLVDYIVIGEGEITFPRLLEAIVAGHPPAQRHLVGEHPDLDAIPLADRDLFLNEWRAQGFAPRSPEPSFCPELPEPFVTLIAGRGCNYNCSFCMPAERYLFGPKTRRRSVANVIAELKDLRDRFAFRSFMFHDDCLTEDRRWVTEFCRAYRAAGFTQPFFCQSRAEIIVLHEDMVRLMAQSGLRGYFIGFESGSDRVLNFLRKGATRNMNLRAAAVCRKYGISIWANYMLGIPTETEAEVRQTISMVKEIDPDYYSPAFYTPHPGSDLYDYCQEHGLSLVDDYDSYRRNPTEPKVRGLDFAFLQRALAESMRRKPANALRRRVRGIIRRYASPRRALRKLVRVAGRATAAARSVQRRNELVPPRTSRQ